MLIKQAKCDKLTYKVFDNRTAMGEDAAKDVAAAIKKLLAEKDEINMIFAAAPSQNDFLSAFIADSSVDFTRINAFHMDEYIGLDGNAPATGLDEENLLLALIAKQVKVEDVISKVSRESYKDLIEQMGIDMVLNPLDIVASTILRYIQGSKRIISSLLIQGQAEIMEIIATNDMKLANVPLAQIQLPDGVLIAAIHRGNNVIIPNGQTMIHEDDKVTIFCLLSDIGELEKLMTVKRGFLRQT